MELQLPEAKAFHRSSDRRKHLSQMTYMLSGDYVIEYLLINAMSHACFATELAIRHTLAVFDLVDRREHLPPLPGEHLGVELLLVPSVFLTRPPLHEIQSHGDVGDRCN